MSKTAAALARRRWSKRIVEKVCPFCEQPFLGDSRQIYCTPAHQNVAAVRRSRERQRRPAQRSGGEQGAGTGGA